jgi:hypothetical protein
MSLEPFSSTTRATDSFASSPFLPAAAERPVPARVERTASPVCAERIASNDASDEPVRRGPRAARHASPRTYSETTESPTKSRQQVPHSQGFRYASKEVCILLKTQEKRNPVSPLVSIDSTLLRHTFPGSPVVSAFYELGTGGVGVATKVSNRRPRRRDRTLVAQAFLPVRPWFL